MKATLQKTNRGLRLVVEHEGIEYLNLAVLNQEEAQQILKEEADKIVNQIRVAKGRGA